jgi:UDP-N-acetyl-D-glucosamine dehydrogenase
MRLRDRTPVVGVIGLGYVDLPQVRAVAEAGYRTLGFDIDPAKPEALTAGRAFFGMGYCIESTALRQHGFVNLILLMTRVHSFSEVRWLS